jgi:hypothetical protein
VEIVLDFNHHGRLHSRSQVEDYMHRGNELEQRNTLDFLVGTYEQRMSQRRSEHLEPQGVDADADEDDGETDQGEPSLQPANRAKRGRPSHSRLRYLPSHPCHDSHIRVVRPLEHNTLPNFIGPRFPRRADPDQSQFYSACVLTLLKPWRSLETLKEPDESWAHALESFLAAADQRTRNIVSSLDHYHACKIAADDAQKADPLLTEESDEVVNEDQDEMELGDEPEEPYQQVLTSSQVTPEMIAQAKAQAISARDLGYAREATEIGYARGVFTTSQSPILPTAPRATQSDINNLQLWQHLLQQSVQAQANADVASGFDAFDEDMGDVTRIGPEFSAASSSSSGDVVQASLISGDVLAPAAVDELFPEQRRAFEIIAWHLASTLNAAATHTAPPPPLRMLLVGQGGTGKSKVIQTVTAEFERRGASNLLLKSAFTGTL